MVRLGWRDWRGRLPERSPRSMWGKLAPPAAFGEAAAKGRLAPGYLAAEAPGPGGAAPSPRVLRGLALALTMAWGQVEGAQERRRLEVLVRRAGGHARGDDVELRAERGGAGVQRGRVGAHPEPGVAVDPVQQGLHRRQRLGRGEGAVPGAVHERLPQQVAVAGAADRGGVGLLLLDADQRVVGGVDGQHRHAAQVTVEGDVVAEVLDGARVGADPLRLVQGPQVGVQAATSPSRARPCGVDCAVARIWLARWALVTGSVIRTISSGAPPPSRTLKANRPSSAWFQVPTPPASTPHIGRAPSKRSGAACTRPAVMMPPSEWPQAMVVVGRPTCARNSSSTPSWSPMPSWSAQPVLAYEEPASAKPLASRKPPVSGSPTSTAGLAPGKR